MTPSANLTTTRSPNVRSRRFRVHDNARALWSVMGVLLLLGFAVLRLLAGASDAPRVEKTQVPGVPVAPDDHIHRLRPQTSTPPASQSLPSSLLPPTVLPADDASTAFGAQLSDDSTWMLPGTPWQEVPGDVESADLLPPEIARYRELVR